MQHIDKDLFEDRLESFIEEEKDSLKKDQLRSLTQKLEEAKWDVDEVLRSVVPSIEDEDLRDDCRRLLIAAKYDVAECYGCRSYTDEPWVDDYISDDCVLLQYPDEKIGSTAAILTPDGRIKTPEGLIWINGRSFSSRGCFNARAAEVGGKHGLVFKDGKIILPCVFDTIKNSDWIEAQYKGVKFSINLLKEPRDGDSKNYKISEKLFLNVLCLGRNDEYNYYGAVAVSKKNDEPQNPEEAFESEEAVKAELYSILDEHYRADLE